MKKTIELTDKETGFRITISVKEIASVFVNKHEDTTVTISGGQSYFVVNELYDDIIEDLGWNYKITFCYCTPKRG